MTRSPGLLWTAAIGHFVGLEPTSMRELTPAQTIEVLDFVKTSLDQQARDASRARRKR